MSDSASRNMEVAMVHRPKQSLMYSGLPVLLMTLCLTGCFTLRQPGSSADSDRQGLYRLLGVGLESGRPETNGRYVKTKVFDEEHPVPVPLEEVAEQGDQAAAESNDASEGESADAQSLSADRAVGTGVKVEDEASAAPAEAAAATTSTEASAEVCPPVDLAPPNEVPAALVLQANALEDVAAEEAPAEAGTDAPPAEAEVEATTPEPAGAEQASAAAEQAEPAVEETPASEEQVAAEATQDEAAADPETVAITNEETSDEDGPAAEADATQTPDAEVLSQTDTPVSDSQQLLNETIASLRAEVEESPLDEHAMSVQQLRLQLLELAAKQVGEKTSPAVREYFEQQMQVLEMLVDEEAEDESAVINKTVDLATSSAFQLHAAADLAVKHLSLCTEVTRFGHYRKFPQMTFRPGQEAVLYLEVDHFVAQETKHGFDTEFRVQYDVLDSEGQRVMTQKLPTDRQTCMVKRRDYFIAYLIYLPQLPPGDYRLQVQVEDAKGEKSGHAELAFQLAK